MKKEQIFNRIEKITYLTPASTVVLVSTIGEDGVKNVAPFAMFMMASTRPPMVIVAISPKADTHANILATKQFVVGIPKTNIVDRLYAAGDKFPPEVDEFVQVGLTPYDSNQIDASKIHECVVNLECTLAWSQPAGNHTVFCGNIVDADIDEGIFSGEISNVELRKQISQLYHITSNAFLSGDKIVFAKKD